MPDSKANAATPALTRAGTAARQGLTTAAAAWFSCDSSTLIGLHEGYWAAISAIAAMEDRASESYLNRYFA